VTLSTVTLGKGVALVLFVIEKDYDISKIVDPIQLDMFNYVKEVYDDLIKSAVPIQLEIPTTSCSSRESILNNNDRFFIEHTLVAQHQDSKTHDQLTKHLNNCYSCFQLYSQFYKDFYQADQEIRQTFGE